MMKKIILLSALCALVVSARGANLTISNYVGTWESNTTLSNAVADDRIYFQNNSNVSLSSVLNYGSSALWITVGSASSGGVLSITSTGGYTASGNMTFGQNTGGSGQLNLSASFRTTGAIYFGYNGGSGTASITNGVLSTSNTIWVGRSQATATSSGVITMSSGIIEAVTALNIGGFTNAAVTSGTGMNAYVDLQGGRLRVGSLIMGNASAGLSNANLTISSAMLQAQVTGAFTMNAASHLTLSAAASTDWNTKGAILAVGGTMSVSSTSTIVLNLTDFDGWDGMEAGDSITLTLISYNSLTAPGGASITAVGLSEVFTLGAFNAGANAATVDITYNPIPEPAVSAALLGLTGLALAIRRRRKA